jgi:hypothetical protein
VATVNFPGVSVCSAVGAQDADGDADSDEELGAAADDEDELLVDEPQAARSRATTGATAIRERRTMKPPQKARDSPAPGSFCQGFGVPSATAPEL